MRLFVKKRYGDELVCNCPNCGDEDHFWYNYKKKLGVCYKCWYGYKGEVTLVAPPKDPTVFVRSDGPIVGNTNKVFLPPMKVTEDLKHYLRSRSIDLAVIERFGLGHCTKGRYKDRVIIPIRSRCELFGFVARTMANEIPKYLYPRGFKVKHHVFNIDSADERNLVIVEGVFDVLRHPERCACIFGKTISSAQIAILLDKRPDRVTVFLDPDASLESITVARSLADFFKVYVVNNFNDNRDPAQIDSREFEEVVASAVRVDGKSLCDLTYKAVFGGEYDS